MDEYGVKDALLLVVGASISAWTGVITARFFEFRAVLRDVLEIVADQDQMVLPHPEALLNHNRTLRTRLRINQILEDQGQYAVGKAVHRICEQRDEMIKLRRKQLEEGRKVKGSSAPVMEDALTDIQSLLDQIREIRIDPCGLVLGKRITAILYGIELSSPRRENETRAI